jgi:hypothetical protein
MKFGVSLAIYLGNVWDNQRGGLIMSNPAPPKVELDAAAEEFARDNPDIMEALRVFGIAASEYERAIRALHPCVISTGSSSTSAA